MNEIIIKTDEFNPYGGNIFNVADFINQIKSRHPDLAAEWFTTGISCMALEPGFSWKSGTLRIAVQFTELSEQKANASRTVSVSANLESK